MLLTTDLPHIMEDEVEEGEIIEFPIYVPKTKKSTHFKHEHTSKKGKHFHIKHDDKHLNSRKSHHVCKNHEKAHKRFSKSSEKDSDSVRIVKYKSKPYVSPHKTSSHKTISANHSNLKSSPYSRAENIRTVKKIPRRYDNFNRQDSSTVDFDLDPNASFEDLLDQYKSIQSRIAKLKKEFNDDKTNQTHSKPVRRKKSFNTVLPNKKKKITEIILPSPKTSLKTKEKENLEIKSPEIIVIDEEIVEENAVNEIEVVDEDAVNDASYKNDIIENKIDEDNDNVIVEDEIHNDEVKDDDIIDDDDLELLRSQALASCAKLPSTIIKNDNPTPKLQMIDNYEIVDMDVSDDDLNNNNNDENLITFADFNVKSETVSDVTDTAEIDNNDDSLDDDEILRAQLLLEMNEKRYNTCENFNHNIDSPQSSSSCQSINVHQNDIYTNEFEMSSLPNINGESESYFVKSSPIKNIELLKNTLIENHSRTKESEVNKKESFEILTSVNQYEIGPLISKTDLNLATHSNFDVSENKFPILVNSDSLKNSAAMEDLTNKENFLMQNDISGTDNVDFQQNISVTCRSDNLSSRKVLITKPKSLPFIPQEPVKPLIIQFDRDSSESSEDEEAAENETVASLEKLIENVKNSSGRTENLNQKKVEAVSNVITDRDEFAKLNKLIGSRDNLKPNLQQIVQMRTTHNSLLNQLFSARSKFQKDLQFFSMFKLQANRKKHDFIASQIEVNRIKLQLKEAEKRRTDIQKAMYDANTKLATVEKTINISKAVIDALQKECLKRGKQLFGEKYILPKIYATSPFAFRRKPL